MHARIHSRLNDLDAPFSCESPNILQHHNWEANRDRPHPNLPPQAGEG